MFDPHMESRRLTMCHSQRKCRDRRKEQVLNLRERLRISVAEKKNLQDQYAKLHDEYDRLQSESGVYFDLLQSFWTSDGSGHEVAVANGIH